MHFSKHSSEHFSEFFANEKALQANENPFECDVDSSIHSHKYPDPRSLALASIEVKRNDLWEADWEVRISENSGKSPLANHWFWRWFWRCLKHLRGAKN